MTVSAAVCPQSSLFPEGLRPGSGADTGGPLSAGGGDQREVASPGTAASAAVSADSRLSGPLQTASIKRSVRGLMNKLSNRVRG